MIVQDINPGTTSDDSSWDSYRMRSSPSSERNLLTAKRTELLANIRTARNRLLQLESNASALGSQFLGAEEVPVLRNRLIGLERELSDIEHELRMTDTESVDYIDERSPSFNGAPTFQSSQERLTVHDVAPPSVKQQDSLQQQSETSSATATTSSRQDNEQQVHQLTTHTPQARTASGASVNSAVSSATTRVGNQMQQRLMALKQKYKSGSAEVADELDKLSRARPPSRFAFLVIIIMGILIDLLNYPAIAANVAFGAGVAVDIILSIIFVLSIRSMMNREKSTQRIFALILTAAILSPIILPFVGILISIPMFGVVMIAGIKNRGVAVHNVNKDKVTAKMQQYGKMIRMARRNMARAIRFGRRTKGLKGVTKALVRSKGFKAVSKGSKTMLRLFGSAIAEMVPIISLLPFNTINAFWTYSDLKKAHIEAVELLAQYQAEEQAAITSEVAMIRMQSAQQNEEIVQQGEAIQEQEEERSQIEAAAQTGGTSRQQARSPSAAPADAPGVKRPVIRDVGPPSASRPIPAHATA